HGVEMRREDDVRRAAGIDIVRCRSHRAGALAEHVAFGVDTYVAQAERLEYGFVGLGPLLFVEGRRRNLTEVDLLIDDPGLVRLDVLEGECDVARLEQGVV